MATTLEKQEQVQKPGHKCSRTNILLNDELIERARQLSGLQTKKDIVQEALRLFVQMQEQEGIKRLRGKLHWEGDLDELRRGRFQDADS